MIPFISSLIFLNTLKPVNNIISIRDYISNNVKNNNIQIYSICDELDGLYCSKYKAKSFIDFLAYLITIDVEYTVSGDYYIFKKKQQ